MRAKPITSAQIIAKAIEVDPASAWLLTRTGQVQSGCEFARLIAADGRQVRFLRWPGGNTVVVTCPTGQTPSLHALMRAYRLSTTGAAHP
jgi:hypothetical protein